MGFMGECSTDVWVSIPLIYVSGGVFHSPSAEGLTCAGVAGGAGGGLGEAGGRREGHCADVCLARRTNLIKAPLAPPIRQKKPLQDH